MYIVNYTFTTYVITEVTISVLVQNENELRLNVLKTSGVYRTNNMLLFFSGRNISLRDVYSLKKQSFVLTKIKCKPFSFCLSIYYIDILLKTLFILCLGYIYNVF